MISITSLVKDMYNAMRRTVPLIGLAALAATGGCKREVIQGGCYEGTIRGMKAVYCEENAFINGPYCTLTLSDEKISIEIRDNHFSEWTSSHSCENEAIYVDFSPNESNEYSKRLFRKDLEPIGKTEYFDSLLTEAYETIYLLNFCGYL